MSGSIPSHSYQALLLGSGSIRLLRLVPHEDEHAPVRCQLLHATLEDDGRPHAYVALSYVWGDTESPQYIYINGSSLCVRKSLHEALLRLRHRSCERLIWIDAICINQENEKEKEQQIRLMPKIYNRADGVVVWLGEEAEDSDRALEAIVLAGNDRTIIFSDEGTVQKAVVKLLHRPWFRRIWVLQEVAAARHIRITCGRMEVDGHAFCLGVHSLKRLYEACARLQSTICSVTYLIRGAIFRLSISRFNMVPIGIYPLGELVDRYHAHEATERHDKVYALLGMSSDNPEKADLFPNYQEPWEDLLRRLVKYLIADQISVETRRDTSAALLRSKGCVLGTVSSVHSNMNWNDTQDLEILWRDISGRSTYRRARSAHWTVQASAKPIRKGDLICLLAGAVRPTIIRLCRDFSAIVVIAATPPHSVPSDDGYLSWSEVLQSVKLTTRDFTLVWDWDDNLERSNYAARLEDWIQSSGFDSGVPKRSWDKELERATRLWNFALVLGDVKEYQAAVISFKDAMTGYEMALSEEKENSLERPRVASAVKASLFFEEDRDQYLIHRRNGWTPLLCAAKEGHEQIFRLILQTDGVDIECRDNSGRTSLSWAAEKGHSAIVKRLLEAKADVNADTAWNIGKTALQAAAEGGYIDIIEQLLDAKADVKAAATGGNGRTALQAAAGSGYLAMVERLLEEGADVNAVAMGNDGRTALQAAAGGGHLAIVQRLLEEKADVNAAAPRNSGRTALQAAAEGGHLAVVERLLEEGADVNAAAAGDNGRTALQAAAGGGYLNVVERLLEEGADINATAAWNNGLTAFRAAAEAGHRTIVELLLQKGAVAHQPRL